MQLQFGTLIWPGIVTYWRKYSGDQRFVKGDNRTTSSVTQMLHDLGWRDLSDRRRDLTLALLYKVVTGHVPVGPDQIGLVAADNRTRANHRFTFRAIGASSSGLCSSFAARTVGDWNQLSAAVVEQESPAAFKNQLDRLVPVACRNAPPPAIGVILHEEVCQLLKTRQDKKLNRTRP